jgi:hypothetical protein
MVLFSAKSMFLMNTGSEYTVDMFLTFRVTVKSPENSEVVKCLVKEVRLLNPLFQAGDIRGMCRGRGGGIQTISALVLMQRHRIHM